ncbi:MAG: penicillin-binding protein 1A [Pseudomonadota bacterium]
MKKLVRFCAYSLSLLLFCLIIGGAGVVYVFYQYGRGLPDYQQLATYEPPVMTRLYAGDGRLFAEYAYEKRVFIPFEAIPKRIVQTFLVAEDKNFYHHFGLDFGGILRAAIMNIKRAQDNLRPMGASTITQQVAKNFLLNSIARETSLTRKIKEAILAFRIELTYSKDHILELYLNEIYLGRGSYGIASAALNYFNKSLDELTIAEAAFLAGLPKAPSRYNPLRYPKLAKIRRDWVIGRMEDEGLITGKEAQEAISQPIVLKKRGQAQVVRADYFAEEVRRDLFKRYGAHALYEDGLTVRTTLDPRLQNLAEKALREGLETYDKRHGWRGPVTHLPFGKSIPDSWIDQLNTVPLPIGVGHWTLAVVLKLDAQAARIGFAGGSKGKIPLAELKWARKYIDAENLGPMVQKPRDVLKVGDVVLVDELEESETYRLCQLPKVSGAIVVMDPHTGRVLGMSGGYSFALSQYNRATQAYRQPGSAFKTFAYLAAFEKGFGPSTKVVDAPFAINLGYGLGVWKPTNYEDKFFGPTTLRVGLEKSRNLATIRLIHELVGIVKVIEVAKRLSVVDEMPKQLATVLGTEGTTPLRMAAAYSMIANGGKWVTPTLIERLQDRKGKTIWSHQTRELQGASLYSWMYQEVPPLVDVRKDVIDPAIAYQIVSILQGAITHGTGRTVRRIMDRDVPLAGKTGSTNDHFDSWFVGFSPDLLVCVYVGFDGPRTLGIKEGGAKVASPIFAHFMKEALKDMPAVPFRVPPGVRLVKVDRISGKKTKGEGPNVIIEAFRDNQIPEGSVANATQESGTLPDGVRESVTVITPVTGTGGIY